MKKHSKAQISKFVRDIIDFRHYNEALKQPK